jgi:hypothetical protein
MKSNSLRLGAALTSPAILAAVLLAPGPASAAPASTAARLPCHASMSNSHPADYTTTYVRVSTVRYAKVTTVAHYKTVNRKHTGTANSKGNASIRYYISGATPGYRVVVKVSAVSGKRSGSCSTSFIPHR